MVDNDRDACYYVPGTRVIFFFFSVRVIYCERGQRRYDCCLDFVVHVFRLPVRLLMWRHFLRGVISRCMRRDGR